MVEIDKIDVYYSEVFLDELNNAFKNSMSKLINNLTNIVYDSVRTSSYSIESYITNILDEYYLDSIRGKFRQIKNSLEEQLRYQVDMLKKKVKADPKDKNRALEYFQDEVFRLFNSLKQTSFEEVNEEFLVYFRRGILNRFAEVSRRSSEDIIYEAMHYSKRYLNTYIEELMDSVYINTILSDINYISSDYIENIPVEEETKKEEKTSAYNEGLMFLSKFFNYTLELQGDSGHFIDSEGRIYPVKRTPNGVVSISGDRIELQNLANMVVFFDPKRMQKITISSANEVKVESLDRNVTFEICENGEEIEFIWNGKKVNQGAQKTVLMNKIKSSYPNVYSIMEKVPSMQKAFEEAQKQEQEEDFFTDDFKINPNNREELEKRLFMAGYTLLEKEAGLYVIDTQTGIEDKLVNTPNGLTLLNNPSVSIAPNVTIISQSLATKCMQIGKGNGLLIISSNFEYFGYTSDKCCCNLTLDQEGMHFSGKGMSEDEVQNLFMENFPNIVEYASSNTLWDQYSIKKEEVKEENVTPQEDQVEEKTGEALLDEKIKELEMDPKVQAYLELLRLKQSLSQGNTMVDEENPTRK